MRRIGIVVKIVLARSHRAKREGQARLAGSNQPLNVVGEGHDSGGNLQIQVGQGATRPCRAGCDGIEEEGGVFGDEGGAQPAVGQLTGEFQAFGAERCQVDRQVRARRRHLGSELCPHLQGEAPGRFSRDRQGVRRG